MFTCRPISALITSILSTAALLKLCHNKTLLMQEYTHTRWKLRVCLTLKKQDIFEFMECFATQQFLKPWNESLTILKSRIRTEKTNVIFRLHSTAVFLRWFLVMANCVQQLCASSDSWSLSGFQRDTRGRGVMRVTTRHLWPEPPIASTD